VLAGCEFMTTAADDCATRSSVGRTRSRNASSSHCDAPAFFQAAKRLWTAGHAGVRRRRSPLDLVVGHLTDRVHDQAVTALLLSSTATGHAGRVERRAELPVMRSQIADVALTFTSRRTSPILCCQRSIL
jgi:hypothetical protein